jgi:hypothetical protein
MFKHERDDSDERHHEAAPLTRGEPGVDRIEESHEVETDSSASGKRLARAHTGVVIVIAISPPNTESPRSIRNQIEESREISANW